MYIQYCTHASAFVTPDKITEDHYYTRAEVAGAAAVLTVVPVHLLHRDGWPSMDGEELSTQKSKDDIERDPESGAALLRNLVED